VQDWNDIIARLPDPHILQTWEWGQFKTATGWQTLPQTWQDAHGKTIAAALVLQRNLPIGLGSLHPCVLYVPKGPLMDWSNAPLRRRVLDELQDLAKKQGAIFIKIDADVRLGIGPEDDSKVEEIAETLNDPLGGEILSDLHERNWRFSDEQIQFRNTVMLDVTPSEDEMLARMKQKSRYNVRLAQKKGVSVRQGTLSDLPLLYRMYAETSVRDGFVIRDQKYYGDLWGRFMQAGMATPLIAEVEGEAVAAIVLFHFGKRAWYLHGMSRSVHREKMPNALIQWEAMRLAKALGCETYDLWGAPDVFNESDSMWGVYLFKRGLGGYVVHTMGAYDLPINPLFYRLYTQTLPRILDVMRRRGKSRTKHTLS